MSKARSRIIKVTITLPPWSMWTGTEVRTEIIPDDDPPIGEALVPTDVYRPNRRTLVMVYAEPAPDLWPDTPEKAGSHE